MSGWNGSGDTPRELTACCSISDGAASRAVEFDAGCTHVPDGASVSAYEWNLGDGASAAGEVVEHVDNSAGDDTVTLLVRDDEGIEGRTTRLARVRDTVLELRPPELLVPVDATAQLAAIAVGDFGSSEKLTTTA